MRSRTVDVSRRTLSARHTHLARTPQDSWFKETSPFALHSVCKQVYLSHELVQFSSPASSIPDFVKAQSLQLFTHLNFWITISQKRTQPARFEKQPIFASRYTILKLLIIALSSYKSLPYGNVLEACRRRSPPADRPGVYIRYPGIF